MSRDTPLIVARDLTKRFKNFTAVDGVGFAVHPAESFGFLGPNGAGKTSTMRMIGCVSPVSAGELRVFGMDPQTHASAIKARLGVVPQQDNLDNEITVRENLLMYARYFDIPREVAARRADELLEFVQLSERANSEVEPLSGGMKRRLTIARSLINEPEVILLDEPTTGLDPQARHAIWDRLYRLKQRGATLLLTTHYMEEAEQLCDRVVIMDRGRIIAEGSREVSSSSTRRAKCSSCGCLTASASGFAAWWTGSRNESRNCRIGCRSTPPMPNTPSTPSVRRAFILKLRWCDDRRSRMSSCASPATLLSISTHDASSADCPAKRGCLSPDLAGLGLLEFSAADAVPDVARFGRRVAH